MNRVEFSFILTMNATSASVAGNPDELAHRKGTLIIMNESPIHKKIPAGISIE